MKEVQLMTIPDVIETAPKSGDRIATLLWVEGRVPYYMIFV